MMSVVTGVAGFIGSHLAEALLAHGHEVRGIDSFTPSYDPAIKRSNIAGLMGHSRFTLIEGDLMRIDLPAVLHGAEYVYHQAGQAGVRTSWGESFDSYSQRNVVATQRLLEALKDRPLRKLVHASSSSVYGNCTLPMREEARPQPVSPYGVTKLAAEHLCHVYHTSYGLPYVALRYFTVYGPRQRPDMAIYTFIRAIAAGEPIPIYGGGAQSRDFTYVSDIVRANLLAATATSDAAVVNICGGTRIVLVDLLAALQQVIGRQAQVIYLPGQRGDVEHTEASTALADRLLGFAPQVALEEGLARQASWQLDRGQPTGLR